MTEADAAQDVTQPAARVVRTGTSAVGNLLAALTRGVAALRPASKPLHPSGAVVTGTLERRGSTAASGVAWVDEAGRDDVVVRLSRAIGLPAPAPDIHGLALRVLTPDAGGDLLLASTGWGRVGRFVLTFGRHPGARPLTTLLPYRTPTGPVLIGARVLEPHTYELSWSRTAGEWHPFACLHLTDDDAPDQGISFDPVRNRLPGLEQYPWVVRLREPAYLRARRSRRS
jgi:hypothetical protein